MELINQYLPVVVDVLAALGGLTLAATLVVRITPSKSDDEVVGKIAGYWLKVIRWFPTIGVNPNTKKLEEALAEYRAQEDASVATTEN